MSCCFRLYADKDHTPSDHPLLQRISFRQTDGRDLATEPPYSTFPIGLSVCFWNINPILFSGSFKVAVPKFFAPWIFWQKVVALSKSVCITQRCMLSNMRHCIVKHRFIRDESVRFRPRSSPLCTISLWK